MRFFTAAASSTEYEQRLANACSFNSSSTNPHTNISVTTITGGTGACVPWRDWWIVLQFSLDGTQGSFVQFEDHICQNLTATGAYAEFSTHKATTGQCRAQVYYDVSTGGYMSVLLEHGPTPAEAVAALAAYVPASVSIDSSTGRPDDGGGTSRDDTGERSSKSSSSLPLTTIGLLVAGCMLVVLAAFAGWCLHDTCPKRSRAAAVHPTYADQPAVIIVCSTEPRYIATE